MSLAKEFKEFAIKGNVVDIAVGVIIGAAFGKIVSSFVSDVVTPPLGLLIGGVDFRELNLVLHAAQGSAPAVVLKYGIFVQSMFDFLIVALAIFAVVKLLNKAKRAEPPPAPVALSRCRAKRYCSPKSATPFGRAPRPVTDARF